MISEEKRQVLDFFAQGRELYKLREFEAGKRYFAKALQVDPDDGPSKVYYARCKHYIDNPPPEDWDGVFVMKSK